MADENLALSAQHPLPKLGDRLLVTLKTPVLVVLQGTPRWVPAFEGELANQSDTMAVFAAMRMFAKVNNEQEAKYKGARHETITMRVDITVPFDNFAGLLPAPKAS